MTKLKTKCHLTSEYVCGPDIALIEISDELRERIISLNKIAIDLNVSNISIFDDSLDFFVIDDEDNEELKHIYGFEDEEDKADVLKLYVSQRGFKWEGYTKYNSFHLFTDELLMDSISA